MTLTGNGNLAVKGDITSNGNKVALDKDVVKLTGDQNISGRKIFDGVIRNTYLTGGVLDTHPESGGTCIGYYTNDLVNLRLRGGSYIIKNLTQNTIIANNGDADAIFDGSPSYYYISNKAANNDVVEIIIKTHITFNWTTRGGIGFGNGGWGAKGVKIEAGYSATNTGTASSPDSDIVWVTRINETKNTLGMIYGILNGPSSSEGGTNINSLNYLRVTLTNFHTTNDHRIASIFLVNYGSTGMLQTFLPRSGGVLYGYIYPDNHNALDLGTSSKAWRSLYSRNVYSGYIKSDQYVEGVLRSNAGGRIANANDIPHYNNENNAANGKSALRLDLATSAMTSNRPSSDSEGSGFIYTNMWDTGNYDMQLYFPWGPKVGTIRPSLRGCNNGTWQTSWTELAYYKDLDNYVPKTTSLADNVDLNTVITSGFYRLNSNPVNGPGGTDNLSHGQLIVSKGADTIAQIALSYDQTNMYIRTGNQINTTPNWRNWKKVSTDGHTHDDRYYTESEVDSKLNGKSNTGHTHQALDILCSIGGSNTNTYPYRRLMSIPATTNSYVDISGTYYLHGYYQDAPWYIFRVEFRTNNSSAGQPSYARIQVIATNRKADDLIGGLYSVVTNGVTTAYLDVYYKLSDLFGRIGLSYLGVKPYGGWTYHNSSESKDSTLPTNAYKTLEGNTSDAASFGARGIEKYTTIAYGSLEAKVKQSNYLLSPATYRLTDANIAHSVGQKNGQGQLRIDLSTGSMTSNKPSATGFIYTNIWDYENYNTQLFIPNGLNIVNGVRPSVRGCNNGTWQTSWTELAYYKDLDKYTKKTIKLSDNVDLDTVTSSGFYRLMNHTQANFPHGQMIVSRGDDTIAQMVFPYDSTRMYVRTGNPFNTSGGL